MAFSTSLAGMSASFLMLLQISKNDAERRNMFESLAMGFYSNYRIETLGDYLKGITVDGQQALLDKQLEAAKKSAEASNAMLDMGVSLQKSAENFDADKLGIHISKSIDSVFRNEMAPLFLDIRNELSSLKEIKQDNGEKVISAIKQEIVVPLISEISKINQLVGASNNTLTRLNDELGGVASEIGSAVNTIQGFQEEIMIKMQDFASELKSVLTVFQTDTKNILGDVSLSIKSAIDESVTGMISQRTAFKESADQASQTFRGIRVELEGSLEKQALLQQDLFDQTATRLKSTFQESHHVFEAQVETMREVGLSTTKLMDASRNSLTDTLANIEQSLLATKDVVEKELEGFRTKYQESLSQFFTEQNNLLEGTLGEQRDGLAKVVADCNEIFVGEYERRKLLSEQVGEDLNSITETTSAVNSLVQSMRVLDATYINTIEEAADAVGRQSSGVEKQMIATQELINQFMLQVPGALDDYFNKANSSHVKFFEGMDDASSKIHTRLLQSAEYLVSAQMNSIEMNESRNEA